MLLFTSKGEHMKKIKIIMTILLSLTMLSGCAKVSEGTIKESDSQLETVQLTVWGGENEQELLAEMVESFKTHYVEEATFDITIAAQSEDLCKSVILGDVNAAPDLFAFADDQLIELAAAGVLEVIKDSNGLKEDNSEGAVSAASINENMYAYPMTADNGYFMYYNKKYLSETDVQTLDQMLAVASSLNKKVTMDWSGWYVYSFFGNTGLTLGLNPDGITNYSDWNSKTGAIKGVDVGNAMLAIAQNPGFLSAGDEGLVSGAKNDTVIAGVSGIWSSRVLEEIWGEDFGAVKLPTYTCAGKQVQLSSYAGYKMIGVNSYSEEKEWAAKLAQWLTNEENQTLRFVKIGLGPSNVDSANTKEVQSSLAIQALLEQSQYASLQRVGAKYWEPVSGFGQALVEGKISASNMQNAMDQMVKKITMKVTD